MEEELKVTSTWLDQELERSILDAKEQISFALKTRKEGVQATEERQVQLEEARLALFGLQAKLSEVQKYVSSN